MSTLAARTAPEAAAHAVDPQIEQGVVQFLYREAELLDARRLEDWLALLHPEIDYRIPVRTVRNFGEGDGFSDTAFFMEEDYGSLHTRVRRLGSPYAWAENPPTRTRRLIANIRLRSGESENREVASNIALYCYRGDSPQPIVITGERRDSIVSHGGSWLLRRRLVLLDITVLGLPSFSVFL